MCYHTHLRAFGFVVCKADITSFDQLHSCWGFWGVFFLSIEDVFQVLPMGTQPSWEPGDRRRAPKGGDVGEVWLPCPESDILDGGIDSKGHTNFIGHL